MSQDDRLFLEAAVKTLPEGTAMNDLAALPVKLRLFVMEALIEKAVRDAEAFPYDVFYVRRLDAQLFLDVLGLINYYHNEAPSLIRTER